MLHQPFEAWILNPGELAPEQRAELHTHLESCAQCRQLAGKWQVAERNLQQATMVSPAPGFVRRWQARLAARQAQNPITLRRITPIMLTAMGVVAFALIVQYFSSHSFTDLINEVSRALIWFSTQVQGLLRVANDWLSNPLAHLPLALIVFVALMIGLVWLTVLWRIIRKGETTQ